MKRYYYYIKLKNISPLHIGSGEKENTDMDVIRDKEGKFFIPGSSIAGCMVHYLDESKQALFNPTDKDINKQSTFFVSDAVCTNDMNIETRTGIQLDENKITVDGAKFDYELIPAGYEFDLRIEITDRDGKDYEAVMNELLSAIDNQSIRLGAKTTRGLGCMEIVQAYKKVFDASNFNEFFKFNPHSFYAYDKITVQKVLPRDYVTVEVSLKQVGGISIRTYNAQKGEADYEHITSNGKPVIPGTSWNGLIRKAISDYNTMFELGLDIPSIFGYVDGNEVKKSTIIIHDSEIVGGEDKEMVRTRINPYHGSTVQGALFKEKSVYCGTTTLRIELSKDENTGALLELLMLFLKDLDEGFLALGGQTSIGRGMFKVNKILIDNKVVQFSDYMEVA